MELLIECNDEESAYILRDDINEGTKFEAAVKIVDNNEYFVLITFYD